MKFPTFSRPFFITAAFLFSVAAGLAQTNLTPLAVTGFNLDVVIENTAGDAPYFDYATELNPGEGTAFYQSGLPGTQYGLPVSGSFTSAMDSTVFQFQPYTTNNALVLSGETGIDTGTLQLVTPATFYSISILAHSASGGDLGDMTINFADGTSYQTTYLAYDWFDNCCFALQGVDRIGIGDGGTDGGPANPRFYQTTLNLTSMLGATNKAIASLTFNQVPGVGATAIYAVSGVSTAQSNFFTLAAVTNLPATNISISSVTFRGQVLSTGGSTPSLMIYYGPVNGGTNPATWANNASIGLQTAGVFSHTLNGLATNTTYFATLAAANFAGTSWATPAISFTTTTPALPVITNLPATNIAGTTATLQGQVLATGGLTPQVTIYYGTSNGGTNAAAWANNILLGPQSDAFAQALTGLETNTTYFYTAKAANSVGTVWAQPAFSFSTTGTNPIPTAAPTAVLTYHNDNQRLGANTNETALTPANVNSSSFGRLFAHAVDGYIYAQPLVMTNVNVLGRGIHDLVIVVTEHNSVYAFDAHDNSGGNASPLWQTSFLGPGVTTVPNNDVGTTDITPEVGITSTPVIDPVTGTIYMEVKTKESGTYVHRIHALDISNGLERTNFNSPALVTCTNYPGTGFGDNDGQNPPHVLWDPLREHCRPAMTLLNGAIYLSYASHGDNGPYHGWMFAYNATNVSQQLGVYNSTPNGGLGGFWDGGGGPSVDSDGNMYFQTGNGSFDSVSNVTTVNNYAMSLMKFSTTNGLKFTDFFAPYNAVALSDGDQDLGSAAPIILPDSAGSTAHRHLVVGGGKTSAIYVVDRDVMGRFNSISNNIVQQFNGGPGGDRDITPAFFNNTMYIIDSNNRIGAYTITNGLFNTTPVESPDGYDNKGGATVSISANGTSNAIAWALYNSGGQNPGTPAVLRAYNATNLNQELYTSDQVAGRDAAGDAVKFTVPTVANGRVYVGAQYSLTVYGLAALFLNSPVIAPSGGIFTNSVTVSITDASQGTTIYYTLDGTAPTTNSILYTAPFALTNSAVIQAFAVKAGAIDSGIAKAGFINSSDIGNGNGLLGQYWSDHTPDDPFSGAPTLVRVDPTVNFNWGNGSPDPSISVDHFTAMWTGAVQPQFNETYTFYATADDGVRLTVNGQLIIDAFIDQAPTEWSGTISLLAGQRYNIEMDYYENGGGAVATLSWGSLSTAKAIIPSTQLYPVINPPPAVAITSPTNGTVLTASATVTLSADAAAQYNPLAGVSFFTNGVFFVTVTNEPYTVTVTGLAAGAYAFTAQASDSTGLTTKSDPMSITVKAGTGIPYGLTMRGVVSPFLNMPGTVDGALPTKLSQTGAFTNTATLSAASGLIPYSVNVPFWSDGAVKTRWMAVPNSGAPYTPDEQITFAPTGEWSFPSGTVFVKHFELATDLSNTNAPKRRLETRLLVRNSSGSVYGVTYKWRPDNSDADLLTDSLNEPIVVTNADHTTSTQIWYYPSPDDCLVCHTPAANYVLGVKTRQLNGNFTYSSNGRTDNQLRALNRVGMFNPSFDEAGIASYTALVSATNTSAPLVDRARSYIDANCSYCHRPGGTGPTFDGRYDTPLASQNIINGELIKGNLGFDHAAVVVPKDIWRSILYQRSASLDPQVKMPPIARNVVDTNDLAVVAAWINSLPGIPALPPPTIIPAGGTFTGLVNVTLQAPDANAKLYYTVDGSLPTTNSILYTGAFSLTNTAIISVNAWETGFTNSVATNDLFIINPGILFTDGGSFTSGGFQMEFAGEPGLKYVLQASTNLTQWISISTNTPVASPFFLVDPGAMNIPYRFYRVIQTQ